MLRLRSDLNNCETLASYTSRLAAWNGLSAPEFAYDMGINFRDIIIGKPEAVEVIAKVSGEDPQALLSCSPVQVASRRLSLNGHVFPSKTLFDPVVRGCPKCLIEDAEADVSAPHKHMSMRGHWLVGHVTYCLKHDHPLVPLWRSSQPGERLDSAGWLRDLAPRLFDGEFTLGDGNERDFDIWNDRDETDFDIWIDQRLKGEATGSWLDQHPLHASSVFCRLLGHALVRMEIPNPSAVDPRCFWGLYQMGFEFARNGEVAIREALRRLQEFPGGPHDGAKKIYPKLYDRLAHDYREEPDYAPFIEILRNHMEDSWPLGPGDDLLGMPVLERKKHSVCTAAKQTGMDQRRLRKLLEAEGVIPEDQKNRPDAWCLFDAAAAQPFLQRCATLLDAKAFRERIGLSRSQFDLLVEDGFLQPALSDSGAKTQWDPASAQEALDRLFSGAIPLHEASHGWSSLSKSAQRLKINPAKILRAILEGKLKRIASHTNFDGFAALYVHHDEVSAVLGNTPPPAMSLEVFAKTVGISTPSRLKRLVKAGHTPSTLMPNPRTNALQYYISSEDAAAFNEKFFTARTLSLHYGQSWQSLSARLRKANCPIFSPDDQNYGTLYLRSDVERYIPTNSE